MAYVHDAPGLTTAAMYELSAPYFAKYMRCLLSIIEKAETFGKARALEEPAVLGLRIYPDMYPLGFQIGLVTTIATLAVAKLADLEQPQFPGNETSFVELLARLTAAIDFVEGAGPERFEGAAEKEIAITARTGELRRYLGKPFLLEFILPNFFFHLTTAYDLLRGIGLEIGKRDFMGPPPVLGAA